MTAPRIPRAAPGTEARPAPVAARWPRVYALAPVRLVSLRDVVAAPSALASPHLARISSLDLSGRGVDDATITVLAQSPHAR